MSASAVIVETAAGEIRFRHNPETDVTYVRLPSKKDNGRRERVVIRPTEEGYTFEIQLATRSGVSLRTYEAANKAWEAAVRVLKKAGAI